MKALKYIFALWAGIAIYAILAVIYGAVGFSAYHQLEGEETKQEANIDSLKVLNKELQDNLNSLLYDKDTLTVYAREQGYALPQEKFIRIVGLGTNQKTKTSSGDIVAAAEPQYTADRTLRIIAFCTAISIGICMAGFDVMKYLRDR